MRKDETRYSNWFDGDAGNYGWKVRLDKNGAGYVGLNQGTNRILLSPAQVRKMLTFITTKHRATRRAVRRAA